MKLKEHAAEKEEMDKELYDLFIEMVEFEYSKASFLKGAKFYCWAHGLQDYANFFKVMMSECSRCKNDFIYHLLARFEEVPEIKVRAIKTNYKSAEEVFIGFVEAEETFVDLLERIAKKANEINDVNAIAFILPILRNINHIACRALEAVKNDKNPFDLVKYDCADYSTC